MTSTVGSPTARKRKKFSELSGTDKAFAALLVSVLIAVAISLSLGAWDQHVQKQKLVTLKKQYPGVNLELTKRRTSVTYMYTAGVTHKQCRAGIDPFADKYTIKVNHQRGVCRKVLVEAAKKVAAAP